MRVFCDDGSTAVKLLWEEKDQIKTQLSPNSFVREWAVSMPGQPSLNYELNGVQYSYNATSPVTLASRELEFQYSDLACIAVHHALMLSGIKPQEIDLVVSLPVAEFFGRDNQPNKANIERKRAALMQPITLMNGTPFTIRDVKVMPESIPAGFDVLGELEEFQSVLICDVGGTTADFSLVMGKGQGIAQVYGDSNLGVSIVTDAVRDMLAVAKTKSSSLRADQVIINRNDDAALKGLLNDHSKIDLIKETIAEQQQKLITLTLRAVDRFNGYSHVLCVGGGALLVADAIKNHVALPEGRFFVNDDPQFALVRGMHKILS